MTLKTLRTAAVAAGLITVAALSSVNVASAGDDLPGVKCYLLGCYDAEGNKVEKPDPTTTASVATAAQAAVSAVKRPGAASRFSEIVKRHASAQGVRADLAHAVIRIESNYRPSARGAAGEIGLMQIKPATARMLGYKGSSKGLYDPETNIRYGMKYLAMAQKLGDGSLCGTILKYNAGHAAKRMNKISAAYCSKVKRELGVS